MTQEVVDRLLDPIQTGIFSPESPVLLFSGAIQDPQGDLEKHSIFKPVSKAEKLRKPAPRASKKHQKIDPRITNKRFLRKHGFCNTFNAKTLFLHPQASQLRATNQHKGDLETIPKKH